MGNTPITFVGTEYQSFLQTQCRDFISGRVSMPQQYFIRCHHNRLSDVRKNLISLLYELINLTDNYLVFSGDFNHSDVHVCHLFRYTRLRVHLYVLLYEFYSR